MKTAFLDPLEGIAKDLSARYFTPAEILVSPERGQLPEGWQTADAVVWSQWPVDRDLIEATSHLRFMQRLGRLRARGDATAALERGIPVSVLPHGTSGRVAEHTFALILGLFRGLLASHGSVLAGENPGLLTPEERVGATPTVNWARVPGLQSLYFKTIGIVGFGEIGACLALLLAPFHTRVLYHKRTLLSEAQERFFGVTYAPQDALLRDSDAVVNLLPVSDATRGLLGEREFGQMKPTAYFVNTGRAATTDEEALVEALSSGRIAGAGLDVFALEPLPQDHPVLSLPNVLLTPHTAGGTPQGEINGLAGWADTFERLQENLRRVEAGEPVLSPMLGSDPQPG